MTDTLTPFPTRPADDMVTLVDETGAEHHFGIVDVVEVNGRDYVLLQPEGDAAEALEDDGDLLVMRMDADDGIRIIDDEAEFQAVVAYLESLEG